MTLFAVLLAMAAHSEPSDKLIDSMVKVESKGINTAIGDKGRAVGILQIHKCVVDDVNRQLKTKYTYADRWNEAKSREICQKYLLIYGGKNATDEKYARIWNGGPQGHKKISTRKYWSKVQSEL